MNREELEANSKLTEYHVIDLNKNPEALQNVLKLNEEVDLINIDLSVDYMTSPISLLKSAYSALKPGGTFVASFSNRMFHTKVVRMWLPLDCRQRQKIVAAYLHYAGFEEIQVHELPPPRSVRSAIDPLNIVVGIKSGSADSKVEL